ncbi:MAG TPA: hypothetical protein ENO24_05435 [Chloroflexi bacterium]|nr:hypothetical protein [Chloroflexota bacterium]
MNAKLDLNSLKQKMEDRELLENARVAYRVAAQLAAYEGSASWSRCNVMLLANSILVAVATSAIANNLPMLWLLVLPAAGIFLCILWWAIWTRGVAYNRHFAASARYLEDLLDVPMSSLRDGARLADGEPVQYPDRPGETNRISFPASIRMVYSGAAVIGLFFAVNLLMLAARLITLATPLIMLAAHLITALLPPP